MSTNYKGEDAGYLVLGIGATPKSPLLSYALIIKNTTGGRTARMFIHHGFVWDTPEYNNEFGVGIVEVLTLQPGKYELCNYSVNSVSGAGSKEQFSRKDFSVPFEVKAGETVYLGNFEARIDFYEGLFGIEAAEWTGFKVRTIPEHDLKIAHEENNKISTSAFINVTPDPKTIHPAFF
jgi:hypothetical protein